MDNEKTLNITIDYLLRKSDLNDNFLLKEKIDFILDEMKINLPENISKFYPLCSFFNEDKDEKKFYKMQDISNKEKTPNYPNEKAFENYIFTNNKNNLNDIIKHIENTLTYRTIFENEKNYISTYELIKQVYSIFSCFNSSDWKNKNYNQFLLVSGGITGIQKYIYTVDSKGALKTLRGRSFFLDFIAEHGVTEVLENLGLTRLNVLYSGGSNFKLLLPNDYKAKETLKAFKDSYNDWLIEKYGAILYFELEYVECSLNDLCNNFDAKLTDLENKINFNKNKKYNSKQLKHLLCESTEYNQKESECQICKLSNQNVDKFSLSNEIVYENICDQCLGTYKLGWYLSKIYSSKKSIKVIISEESLKLDRERYDEKLILPLPTIISTDKNKKYLYVDDSLELQINEDGYAINNFKENKKSNILIGNYILPNDNVNNSLTDFEQLVTNDNGDHEIKDGIKRIAVMRADVDNLGFFFKDGFSDLIGDKSIIKYSSISKQLALFYKYHMNDISEAMVSHSGILINNKDDLSRIVICYSGGDDVFIVGSLNHIIELSISLQDHFKRFTNGKLQFSAGIGMFKTKYPVYKMAEITGMLESLAKKNEYFDNDTHCIKSKNSIALFEIEYKPKEQSIEDSFVCKHVYKWDTFINKVYKQKLIKLYEWFNLDGADEKITPRLSEGNSFFYNMHQLLDKVEENDKINLARLAYLIARHEPNGKKEDKLYFKKKELFNEMSSKVLEWSKDNTQRKEFITALQIVLYTNRTRSVKNV